MTAPFRFVHCAELRLDAPVPLRPDGARRRVAAQGPRALRRLVDLCLQEGVEALLVAGGLFDEERLEPATEEEMVEQLGRAAAGGVSVVVACGRADPGREGGRARAVAWPDGVTVVTGPEPTTIVVKDQGGEAVGRIVARGHGSAHETGDWVEGLVEPSGPLPTVALLPVTPWTPEEDLQPREERRAGLDLGDLGERGFRYWALGGGARAVHGERPAAHDPGPLFPRDFDRPGAAGALLVSVPASGPAKVEPRALAGVRWETVVLDEPGAVTEPAQLLAAARAAIDEARAQADHDAEWIVRVAARGACPAAAALRQPRRADELADELATRAGVLAVELATDDLVAPGDPADFADDAHLLALSLAVIGEAAEDDKLADRLAPRTLAGCVGAEAGVRRAWARELLADMGPHAVEALWTGDDR